MAECLDGPAPRFRLAFFIALFAAAVLILAPLAAGRGLLDPRVGALEFARDAAAAKSVIDQWDKATALEAIRFDYPFIIAYVGTLVLVCMALSRALRGAWTFPLVLAAIGVVIAGVLDVRENGAMNAMLTAAPTDELARFCAWNATAKFSLLGVGIAVILVALVAWLRRRRPDVVPDADMPDAPDVPPSGTLLPCDLVMKGGITSGIVFPQAIGELARHYEFRNIGGASAGAIAAGLAAAAEYARKATSPPAPGLPNLERLPQWLARPGRLLELFRPDAAAGPLFAIFLAALRGRSAAAKSLRAIAAAVRSQPGWAVAGLLPGAVLGWWPLLQGATSGIAIFILISLVAVPASVAAGALCSMLAVLPRNWFGICSGMAPAPDGQTPSLTHWLTDVIERLASGLPPDRETALNRHHPLTFGDLRERGINFELLTTSLTHGRPYRIPFDTKTLFFRAEEFEKLFPPAVVKHMKQHAPDPGDGYRHLPPPDELPVVVAIRMSLSFPILLTAVPLYAVDYNSDEKRLERCWFSDGGIGSNFPIHFFDRLLPHWPTFGIDLTPVQRHWVYLPQRLADGRSETWNRFDTLPGFFGALVNAIHSWMDNRQARAAGFRDRIVRISLGPGEGGLNVDMPPKKIRELADRGGVAGRLLLNQFAAPNAEGWDRQLWARYRLLMSLLEEELPGIASILKGDDLRRLEAAPPAYPFDGCGFRPIVIAQIGPS